MKFNTLFALPILGRRKRSGAFTLHAATHNGSCHAENEDDFYINGTVKGEDVTKQLSMQLSDGLLAVVCDGMGGEQHGGLASAIAASSAEKLHEQLNRSDSQHFTAQVNAYTAQVNNTICGELCAQGGHSGSTFAMVYVRDGKVHTYSLGDSRIYLYHGGELKQISQDHTLAMKKYQTGIYTLEQAQSSPDSHKLTLFLGVDTRKVGLSATEYPVFGWESGMKLLLCSDGLYDMCTEQEISVILSSQSENHAAALVERAVANGGIDNITCIVIQ